MKPLIQTSTGKLIDLTDPKPEDIDIRDIAKALSNLSRFTGHVGFYSVAEHSVGVAFLAKHFAVRELEGIDNGWADEAFKAGLLHDAVEAYLGDVSSPLKSVLPEYKRLEKHFMAVVARKYHIYTFKGKTSFGDAVDLTHAADRAMLELERQYFFGRKPDPAWPGFVPGFEVELVELHALVPETPLWGSGKSFRRFDFGLIPDDAERTFWEACRACRGII